MLASSYLNLGLENFTENGRAPNILSLKNLFSKKTVNQTMLQPLKVLIEAWVNSKAKLLREYGNLTPRRLAKHLSWYHSIFYKKFQCFDIFSIKVSLTSRQT